MQRRAVALVSTLLVLGAAAATPVHRRASADEAKPAVADVDVVTVRGTVAAVDKDQKTVTLKGPMGRTLTLAVRDPQKLDAIQVGDPVIARYYESLVVQVEKAGQVTPGASVRESISSSKPGETPGGAIGRQLTVIATITALDPATGAVTFKGPQGNVETVKAQDRKMLENVNVGDHVMLTYTQALAIALDKP
jgi:hypothetical protein